MRKLLLIGACLAALASWSAPSEAQQSVLPSGPPYTIGCAYNSAPPTLASGFGGHADPIIAHSCLTARLIPRGISRAISYL